MRCLRYLAMPPNCADRPGRGWFLVAAHKPLVQRAGSDEDDVAAEGGSRGEFFGEAGAAEADQFRGPGTVTALRGEQRPDAAQPVEVAHAHALAPLGLADGDERGAVVVVEAVHGNVDLVAGLVGGIVDRPRTD